MICHFVLGAQESRVDGPLPQLFDLERQGATHDLGDFFRESHDRAPVLGERQLKLLSHVEQFVHLGRRKARQPFSESGAHSSLRGKLETWPIRRGIGGRDLRRPAEDATVEPLTAL